MKYAWMAFPQDAISTYEYLLKQGVKPSNIVFSGSSSGGHLVLSLMRYILEHPATKLPKPGAIAVSNPWVDLLTSDYTIYLQRTNYSRDYIDMPFITWARNPCVQPDVVVANHPYLSIKHHPFGLGGVPVWSCIGQDEVPSLDLVDFAKKPQNVAGNDFGLYEHPHAPHDVMWTSDRLP